MSKYLKKSCFKQFYINKIFKIFLKHNFFSLKSVVIKFLLIFALLNLFFIGKGFTKSYSRSLENVAVGKIELSGKDNNLKIFHKDNQTIVNWKEFSISKNEIVNIFQNKEASSLYRVIGKNPSFFKGHLKIDNGKFFFVNQNGIHIGKTGKFYSKKDLILSTANISNEDFLNGKDMRFFLSEGSKNKKSLKEKFSENNLLVTFKNEGKVKSLNGDVFIISKNIVNENEINAKNGSIHLASSKEVFLQERNKNGEITVKIKEFEKNSSKSSDSKDGKDLEAEKPLAVIKNKGKIQAQNVFIKTIKGNIENLGSIRAFAVNQDGLEDFLEQSSNSQSTFSTFTSSKNIKKAQDKIKSRIKLVSGKSKILLDGVIKAEHNNNNKNEGGKIFVLAEDVEVAKNAIIDVSAKNKAGKVFIGRKYTKNLKRINSETDSKKSNLDKKIDINSNKENHFCKSVFFEKGSKILASSLEDGGGGEVILFSDKNLDFQGTVSAEGGKNFGDGGFVEISSKGGFNYKGNVSTLATNGKIGTLLFDPTNISIQVAGASNPVYTSPTNPDYPDYKPTTGSSLLNVSDLQTGLASNNVEIRTDAGGGSQGTVLFNNNVTWSANTTLKVWANSVIDIVSDVIIENTYSGTNFDAIDFYSNGDDASQSRGIFLRAGVQLKTVDGNITLFGKNTLNSSNGSTGIYMSSSSATQASLIKSTGSGNISMTGISGGGGVGTTVSCRGLFIYGNSTTRTEISTATGNIELTGTSNGRNTTNAGLYLIYSDIKCTGASSTGTITLTGDVGSINPAFLNNHAVLISTETLIESQDGDIRIYGTINAANTGNYSVYISGTGTVQSVGNGNITFAGPSGEFCEGGGGTDYNSGIRLFGFVISKNGNITMKGKGKGTGRSNYGIQLDTCDIYINAPGTGSINLEGIGGDGAQDNFGIYFQGSNVAAETGNIYIKGTGGNGTTANHGVNLVSIPNPFSNSGGDIFIEGISGSGASSGIIQSSKIMGLGASNIEVTAYGSGTSNDFQNLFSTNVISSGSGNITIITDTANLGGQTIQSSGNLLIKPYTSNSIGLAGAAGTLTLSTSDISGFQDGFSKITIGDNTNTTSITSQAVTFLDALDFISDSITLAGNLTSSSNDINFTIGNTQDGTFTINSGLSVTSNSFNVTGGSFNDTFNILSTGLSAILNAGSGTNTLVGPNATNSWNITSSDGGSITTGPTFSNFSNLTGGSSNDSFVFTGAYQITGLINGGTGSNSITGPNVVNAWVVTADNAGTLTPTGASGATTFSNVHNLAGGSNTDSFVFTGAYQISGTTGINGGTGSNSITGPNVVNAWAVTSANTGTLTPTGASGLSNFQNIQTLTGGTGADTLTGIAAGDIYTISGDDAGSLTSGAITFLNFENLTGAAGDDSFVFGGAYQISGLINGGTGSNSITGPNVVNAWAVTADNAGTLTPTGASGATTFSNVNNLVGGSNTDSFVFTGAYQISGTTGINGGTGSNSITGPNVVNAWAVTSANTGTLTPTGASGLSNFQNIQTLTGGTGADTLTGIAAGDTYTISGDDAGSLITGVVTFSNFENLTGAAGDDSFVFGGAYQISGLINGGAGTNSITGPNVVNSWAVTSANTGTLTPTGASGLSNFQNIQTLTGGTGADTLTGIAAGDIYTISADDAGSLTTGAVTFSNFENLIGGAGNDIFVFTGAYQISGVTGINGGAGTNSITGPNVVNAWTVTADNAGTLTPTGASGATTFSNVHNLIGGSNTDSFVFTGAYRISGVTGINGSGGSNSITGPNVVNSWAVTSANTGTLTPTGASGLSNFQNIQTLTGGTGADTLTGIAAGDTYTISGDDAGSLITGAVTFSNFENLTGAAGDDSFVFGGAYQISGLINGGAGTNSITGPNVVNSWAVTSANTGTLTPTGASGLSNFQNIQTLTGGTGADTLTGIAAGDIYTISADDAGSLTTGAVTFSNFENLIGGAGDDSFVFGGAYQISGTTGINGGAGTNSITGPNVVNAWTVTADNAGTLTPTGASGATTFSNVHNLAGGSAADTFIFNGAYRISGVTGINGGTGSNFITGPNVVNAWAVTADNAGALTPIGASGATTFSNIHNLIGGSTTDTFTFNGAYRISGVTGINGSGGSNSITGPNVVNSWAVTSANTGTLTPTGASGLSNFQNIQTLTGGTGADTLTGIAAGDIYTILADDAGSLTTGAVTFSNFENLIGGAGSDSFVFGGAYQISGTTGINGGAGTNSITGPNVVNSWAVTSANTGTLTPTGASGLSNFQNIQTLTGGTGADTLTGIAAGDIYTISADDAGSLTTGAITFSNFENLIGGAGDDSFVFGGAYQISGLINGGAGTNSITGPNVVNAWVVTADNAGTLTPTGASGATTFSNVHNLAGGSAADTFIFNGAYRISGVTGINGGTGSNFITGPNVVNAWAVTADNAGALTPTGASGATTFSNMHNLIGGSTTDTFTFNGAYRISGVTGINGSGGSNSITGPNVVNSWAVTSANTGTLTPTGASGLSNFQNIQTLTGGTGADTLTGVSSGDTWTITSSNGGSLTTGAISFSNFESLIGGVGGDNFVFNDSINFLGTIDGGAGTNSLNYNAWTAPVTVDINSLTNIQSVIGAGGGNNGTLSDSGSIGKSWVVSSANQGTAGAITFSQFSSLSGGSGSDTLQGVASGDTWTITSSNGGSLTTGAISFSNFESLIGGVGGDNFVFNDSINFLGTIDGGAGTNSLNYNAWTAPVTVDINSLTNIQSITGAGGGNNGTLSDSGSIGKTWTMIAANQGTVGAITFSQFSILSAGSGVDTITGIAAGDTWSITANNEGTLTTAAISFSNFENLTGGSSGDDSFVFSDQKGVSGIIDGGSSSPNINTLDYSLYTTAVSVDLLAGTATGTGGILNIQNVIEPPSPTPSYPPIYNSFSTELTSSNNSKSQKKLYYYYAYDTPISINTFNLLEGVFPSFYSNFFEKKMEHKNVSIR